MFAYTCFNNGSHFGYTNSQLKSGICKYFRRNEKEKLLWCISELGLFCKLENKGGNGIVTNLVNRLNILIMEDLDPSEIDRIIYGIDRIADFIKSDKKNIARLIEMGDVLCSGKKSRVCSYVNNWWKYNNNLEIDYSSIELKNVIKFKKEGDSEELLKLGELLILKIEEKSEDIIGILNRMINIKENQGRRYKRKEGVYLYWEIIEDFINKSEDSNFKEKLEKICKFAINIFYDKGRKERYYYAIWIGIMIWRRDIIDFSKESIEHKKMSSKELQDYINGREKLILDDYVVNDWHVSKKFGLGKFGKVGAYVVDEDTSLIGDKEKADKYKAFYIEIKEKMDNSKDKKKKDKKDKKEKKEKDKNDLESKLKFIDWSEFKLVKVIEEGVCCGKMCCMIIEYQSKRYILKEMNGKCMNYGRDYMFIDNIKSLFDIKSIGMMRIRCNKGLLKKDKKKKTFVRNWEIGEKDCVYCIMNEFSNIGDLGKNKEKLCNREIIKELYKIRLFDGLFRSSDNILRNILVNDAGILLSIDEGDIFGKRSAIFNKNDWCVKEKDKNMDLINEVLEEMLDNFDYKKDKIIKMLDIFGFSDKIDEFNDRYKRYKEIVLQEL